GVALFDSLRAGVFAAIRALELPYHMGYAIRLERALFAGETLPTYAQAALIRPGTAGLLAHVLVAVHASHFVVFLLFGLGLWLVRRDAFGRFASAMLLLMSLGVAGYLAVPTIPPWMAARLAPSPPIHSLADEVYGQAIPGLRRAFDTNPIAAMPSLHAAFAAICTLVAFHELGPWGWALAAYLGLASLAAVALGEHYFVDLVAGWLLAGAVNWLLYRSAGGGVSLDGPGRAPGGAVESTATGWRGAISRRLLLATGFLLIATAVSQLTLRTHRPFTLTERFVQRELGGHADVDLACPRC